MMGKETQYQLMLGVIQVSCSYCMKITQVTNDSLRRFRTARTRFDADKLYEVICQECDRSGSNEYERYKNGKAKVS